MAKLRRELIEPSSGGGGGGKGEGHAFIDTVALNVRPQGSMCKRLVMPESALLVEMQDIGGQCGGLHDFRFPFSWQKHLADKVDRDILRGPFIRYREEKRLECFRLLHMSLRH